MLDFSKNLRNKELLCKNVATKTVRPPLFSDHISKVFLWLKSLLTEEFDEYKLEIAEVEKDPEIRPAY